MGQASLGSLLNVGGGLAISNGSTPYSTTAAPAGGAIIEGKVGIVTMTPQTSLNINGALALDRDSIGITADNQTVTVGDNSNLFITSSSNAAGARTMVLSSGLVKGQMLYIVFVGTSNQAELADAGNCKLSALMTFDADNTLTLMWNGSAWVELARSVN